MSNLLKSKFILGVVMVAVMFVGALALSTEASAQTTVVSASEFTYSGVMKVGMSGPGISTLQAALNTVNTGVSTVIVDGKFGPATLGAVQRFQSQHGLVADGVVGPMTGEALRLATRSLIVVPTGPATATLCPNGMTFASSCTLPPAPVVPSPGPLCPNGMTLASNCMVSPSGSMGPFCPNGMTLASNCTSNGSTPPSSGNDNNLSGGETDINNIDVNDADDDTINEGANKAPVAELQFDVDDADATLVRADVVFQASNTADESDPWKAFDNVYLMDGNRVVASVGADDEDNWDDADSIITSGTSQASRIRFNNIDEDYQEGDNASLWVAVDVASSVDGASTDADWTVGIDNDGLRFTDGAGLDTVAESSDTATFSIEEAGGQSDFTVRKGTNSPDATTLEVKANTSTEETIAIFKVDADEDGGDIKINDFPIGLKLNVLDGNNGVGVTSNFADVISDVFVTLDGTEYRGDYVPGAAGVSCGAGKTTLSLCANTDTATFTFDDIDDDDVVVAAGDDMDVKVSVKFKSQGSANPAEHYANNTTIQAFAQIGLAANNPNVEDADSGDDIGDVSGNNAPGEVMTLAGTGISLSPNSTSAAVTLVDGNDNDLAVFTIKVNVTAFGDDAFISQAGATAYTAQTQFAATHNIAGSPLSESRVVSSTADTEGGSYRVDEGTTETFTFIYTVKPALADQGSSIEGQLLTVNSSLTDGGATTPFTISADTKSDYRTNGVVVPD